MEVVVLKTFVHDGKKLRGQRFHISDNFALQMERRGMVRVIRPAQATGRKSSASLVAQVSQKQTAKESKSGVVKAKTAKS